jgi:hypothetical protein
VVGVIIAVFGGAVIGLLGGYALGHFRASGKPAWAGNIPVSTFRVVWRCYLMDPDRDLVLLQPIDIGWEGECLLLNLPSSLIPIEAKVIKRGQHGSVQALDVPWVQLE